ncbi:uncharacterized protein LDX57_012763 [Aspergillus melleus]|uniref:uncharacterized protein n=1 Tax=Aspergillus melleus TaxID=138277 RepID=UPI001E8D8988|nr:uncharacterized protein LDX57_012763 [Aspergillus melleus]KAH8435134.1 hypothetical protein LDX57_012763 [Aspergillus melleus]
MLLHACLAVSAKQLSRAPQSTTSLTLNTSPVYYYQQALREMSHFLIEPSYSGSDELLASSIILSTYEILDVSGPSFGSHLKGVASLIRSHRITGDETGIRGATYWTWYRHEVWVAFQTGRRMFLDEGYWQPKDVQEGFEGMSMRDVANRVLFVFGQCVSWYGDLHAGGRDRSRGELCTTPSPSPSTISTSATAMRAQQEDVETQRARANELRGALEEWKRKLPVSMRIYFRQTQPQTQSQTHGLQENGSTASTGQEINQFPATWYAYPESAISHQLYHASKILLGLHTPSSSPGSSNSNENNPLRTRRELERSRREIFMIANSRIDQTWGLISTQCLYVAGLVTEGILERECTLELIEMCQRVTGRQTVCIADQLRGFWQEEE